MHIIICDDENIQKELLKKYVEDYFQEQGLSYEITMFDNAQSLWWAIKDGLVCDLFLLDIQMPGMSGIELAHQIREEDRSSAIAFVTGIKDFVFEGYEVNAISYILKPYEKSQIYKVLDKVLVDYNQKLVYSLWNINGEMVKLYHDDIIYLEAFGHDTIIKHRKQKEIISKMGLMEAMKILADDNFLKVHRSFIINLKNVLKVTRTNCVMIDNHIVSIARGNYDMVMQAFIQTNKRL